MSIHFNAGTKTLGFMGGGGTCRGARNNRVRLGGGFHIVNANFKKNFCSGEKGEGPVEGQGIIEFV